MRARAREEKNCGRCGVEFPGCRHFFYPATSPRFFFLAALFVFHFAIGRIEFQNLDLLFVVIARHLSDLLSREMPRLFSLLSSLQILFFRHLILQYFTATVII